MAHIETLHNPDAYSQEQIDEMLWVHAQLPYSIRIVRGALGQPVQRVMYPKLLTLTQPDGECGQNCQQCAREREQA